MHAVEGAAMDGAGRLQREAGLADPARAGERDEPDAVARDELDEVLQLALAADKGGRRRGKVRLRGRRRGPGQRGILVEDRAVQRLQLGTGVDPELLDQQLPPSLVDVERLGLAT